LFGHDALATWVVYVSGGVAVVVTWSVVPVWTTLATCPWDTCVRKNEYDLLVSAGDWSSHV
jgi:hypothetical protein